MACRPIHFALTVSLAFSAAVTRAQSTLPSTPPTAMPGPPTAMPGPIAATPTAAMKSHRAQVTFVGGMLNVRADNSSLNLILREIARQTGMTITGGVADERVFGNYGPADPGTILATLLGGTGSNMLLQMSDNNTPAKLTLTPRTGGVTPPNPNAPSFDGEANTEEELPPQAPPPPAQQPFRPGFPPERRGNAMLPPGALANPDPPPTTSVPASIPQPANNVNGSQYNTTPTASTFPTTNSVPTDALPTPSTTPSSTGIVDSANPPPPGTTTSTDPTSTSAAPAAATPEDIYKQLQALHAQQPTGTKTNTTPQTTTPQP